MTRGNSVPINNQVLQWAIRESGFSEEDLAERVKAPVEVLRKWQTGESQPNKTQFDRLWTALRRPSAMFFLPEPPESEPLDVLFRNSSGAGARALEPGEMNHLRTSEHLQGIVAWLLQERGARPVDIAQATLDDDPVKIAAAERRRFAVSIERQYSWKRESQAIREWRLALESRGVLVFQLPIGSGGIPGFVLWNDYAPLIAVNSGYAVTNRIFTLFHEYAHLLLRESSIDFTLTELATNPSQSRVERWCDRFSAAFLMPAVELEAFVATEILRDSERTLTSTAQVRRVANRYRVSRSAAARRLRDLGLASTDLVRQVDAETRPQSGGGGGGDPRPTVRIRQFGTRVPEIMLDALSRNQLARHDVLDYLGLNLDDLPAIEEELESTPR